MYLRSPNKARKSGRGSPLRYFTSLFYALLCAGLAGLLIWVWWPTKPVKPKAPTKPPAPMVTAPAPTFTPPAPIVTAPPPLVTAPVPASKPRAPIAAVPLPPIPQTAPPESRPVETILEAQIALARQGLSPGSIDGRGGSQTRAALIAFQVKNGLAPSGLLDAQTKSLLLIGLPAMTAYTVSSEDLGHLRPLPKTWLEKSGQTRLDFENILELLGEKAFANPQLIQSLNPHIHWSDVAPGTQVTLPRVEYPALANSPAFIKISLQKCVLELFDTSTNLLAHFPCSIGHVAAKRPVGELHVTSIALDPNYTFDPAIFPESPEAQAIGGKLILPPGPKNPVGVAWIGLDRPGYGIHGTPNPTQIGRTESHGCFRLANWDASFLAKQVWVGMEVKVE